MKLTLCCVAAVLLSMVNGAAVDVEKTVQQVQSILESNAQLPRLSREDIIELLNDIRAEDARSKSASFEHSKQSTETESPIYDPDENEVYPVQVNDWIEENSVSELKDFGVTATVPSDIPETTTKKESTVMVVLPYTPRDAASLQELYTKPPRTEVLPVSKVTPKPLSEKANEKLRETLKSNAKLANQQKLDIPAELQAFLDSHGLKGKPGQDNFLLPLEGFKPLPQATVIDGRVELPENILLSYDLISPEENLKPKSANMSPQLSPNYLYEPLAPQYPFELETSSSEQDKTVLPLTMPQKQKTKPTATTKSPKYEPIDYDSIKVVPLTGGPSPVEDGKVASKIEQNKRQTNSSSDTETPTTTQVSVSQTVDEATTSTESNDLKVAMTNAPPVENDSSAADSSDSGASIADLEESFGGSAPEVPGDSQLPPPKKNGFYWMVDWNSFLEVGDGDTKVNIRFEPKLGDPQMFLPVTVP